MQEYSSLVDIAHRTIGPHIWTNPEIYRQEQERVFRQSWLYVGHDSQIPLPGDFITNYMGEEPVLVWRGREGEIRVFLNSCRHRGMRLCRVDDGNAQRLTCPFRGWTYDSSGKLVAVPQFQNAYFGELDREQWGLIEVPRVQAYRGLIFACIDPGVPDLNAYLGDARWYLDLAFGLSSEGLEALSGTQKWTLNSNWKLGAENFAGDNYHTQITHASFITLGQVTQFGGRQPWERDFEVKLEGGHGILCITGEYPPDVEPTLRPYFERLTEKCVREGRLNETQARMVVGGVHVGTIFPNFSYSRVLGCLTVRNWHPRGVDRMEAWVTGLIEKDAPEAIRQVCRRMMIRGLGASGLIEMDDTEVWNGCQETLRGAFRADFPVNYQMGAGHERREADRPGLICASPKEASCFGFYERWVELMNHGDGAGRSKR